MKVDIKVDNMAEAIADIDKILTRAAPSAVLGSCNISVKNITEKGRVYAANRRSRVTLHSPVTRYVQTGQYANSIIPVFATKISDIKAEVHVISPHGVFAHQGTGQRGKRTAMEQATNFVHGSIQGMEADNSLVLAARDEASALEKRTASMISNKYSMGL